MGKPEEWAHNRGVKILDLSHEFSSNVDTLIHNPLYFEPGEIYSQVTNWDFIVDSTYSAEMDSHCFILDSPDLPLETRIEASRLFVQGPIAALEAGAKDRRWAILGNLGLWYRHVLLVQEKHGFLNLHAASIYKPEEHELILIVGKAGSGKTVFLLEAISRGYQVFSTEMTYLKFVPEGVRFYRGAMFDNIRAGTLIYDFPGVLDQLGIVAPTVATPWDHKISVDMRSFSTKLTEIDNPDISFVFPRIEKGIKQAIVRDVSDQSQLINLLFDNASEKTSSTFLLYGSHPVTSLDTPELAASRLGAVSKLVGGEKWEIKRAVSTLAGPANCMEGIDR